MANAQSAAPLEGAGDVSPTGVTGSTANSKMRKRTKTGCLTCRKRRIKCGEERPTCANCIKSKRQCEGYNQRVVFKPPIGDWPNHPGVVSTIQYHTSMLPGSRNPPFRGSQPVSQAQDNTLGSIQPQPLNSFDFSNVDPNSGVGAPNVHQVFVGGGHGYAHEPNYHQPLPSPLHQQPLHSPHHQTHMSTTAASYFPQPSPVHTSPPTQFKHDPNASYPGSLSYSQSPAYPPVSIAYDSHLDSKPTMSQQQPLYRQSYQSSNQPEAETGYRSHASVSPRSEQYPQYPEPRPAVQRYNSQTQTPIHSLRDSSADMSQAGSYNLTAAVSNADFSHSSYPPVQIPIYDMTSDVKYMQQPVLEQPVAVSQTQQSQPQLLMSGFGGDDYNSPTQVLDEAAIENEDDDYWDVQSDEEMIDMEFENNEDALLTSGDFNNIRRIHLENFNELGIRRYDTFLYDGLLSQYRPEYAASPLRNPKTARVFAHYIHVTGPNLSIYERNPRNPTLIFEGATPPTQQGLWTYILPLKALSHQGLLHAMLALASLHIARLQGASVTPSYKHYAYSLKRLGRSLSHPRKRLSISTLATSLLLAYYEVWTAEHVKWSTHLVGAAQLITELDFRSLTREARRLRAAETAQERQYPYQNPEMLIDQRLFEQRLNESIMMPDEGLVSTIVGKKVSYDEFGMVFEENGARQETGSSLPGALDLRNFETLQDLYWYRARHDTYQSIVSGKPLIHAYRKWSDCPPRAPLGRADALYGSHDHIILLIGRIADFTVRDRERKLRQVEADGGWKPRPGMPGFGNMGPPPSTGRQNEQPPTLTTPMGPPPHMQAPPPGWTGPPPPGWKGPPPPGFGPSQGTPKDPPTPGSAPQSQGHSPPQGPPPSAMPTFYGMAPSQPSTPFPASYENPNYESSPPTPNIPHPRYADLPAAYDSALAEWNSISAAHTAVAQILATTDSFAPLPAEQGPPVPGGNGNMTPFGPALVHRSYDISVLWTLVHLAQIILLRSHPAMPPAAHMAAGVCAQATQPYAMLIGRITAGMQIPLGEGLSPFLGAVLTESTMPLFFAGIQFQDPEQRYWLITRLLEVDRRTGWASAGMIARGCETAWEKAASLGRGPPYTRRTRRVGEKGPLILDELNSGRRANWKENDGDAFGKGAGGGVQRPPGDLYRSAGDSWDGAGRYPSGDSRGMDGGRGGDGATQDGNEEEVSRDTRYVVKSRMPPWAMNLLGTEEDLRAGMERVGL
ncbi:Nn.00g022090.m01.CDS01 [Neocucurbitaria sp. VM-36]